MVTMLEKLQLQDEYLQSTGEAPADDAYDRSHPATAYRIQCIESKLAGAILVYNYFRQEKRRHEAQSRHETESRQGLHQAREFTMSIVGWKPLRTHTKYLISPSTRELKPRHWYLSELRRNIRAINS